MRSSTTRSTRRLPATATAIDVKILPGDVIYVRDNGRGVPVGVQQQTGLPAVTVVYTILHAGGKFGGGSYKVSGGLHGVGASVVNALSTWLEVEVRQTAACTASASSAATPSTH